VSPGYYMNKRHWISIMLDGELPLAEVLSLCQDSYELVVTGLTRKQRESLASD
jgi:predicted DNA-binding protein (MmcQ/YjbR family)